ncbi:hypothetical protein SAMN02745823_03516 [Sporobacter termitidis DSM 10068]|uniref:Uncharacterized protein n=1 Tax=Sporobacter termitidis DSM 10068 TaxID=1123282 RepID=A0A1M5ZCH3_9FIRM|nr:hypothetical protein [Sporobacter termitidis]SHI21904.1 hypothetical protein SAMN02745823_03516 [Sporobacter termitidis DSM 10068]
MAWVIVSDIEKAKKEQGLAAAQDRYRAWFVNMPLFAMYKAAVDGTLTLDGNADCIVLA